MTTYLYFLRDGLLGVAHRQAAGHAATAREAISQLLRGPTSGEVSAGLATEIPASTELLGLSVAGRLATVDLSSAFSSGAGGQQMMLRAAQVTLTLTKLAGISRVQLLVDGRVRWLPLPGGMTLGMPVQRSTFESVMPAILVETPAPGEVLLGAVRIAGTADVFEAQFRAELRDNLGHLLVQGSVTASAGTGTRGRFEVIFKLPAANAGGGSLTVYDLAAKDGGRIDEVSIPVILTG